MKTYTTRAWIIRVRSQRDNTSEITCYTPDLGKICLKIQGGKKISSKLISGCDIFREIELSCAIAEGAYYGRLISVKDLVTIDLPCDDMERFIEASFICEVLDKLTPYALPNERKYGLFKECITWASARESHLLAGIYFFLNFLKLSGQGLELEYCQNCRTDIKNEVILTPSGIICYTCAGKEKYCKKISRRCLQELKDLLTKSPKYVIENAGSYNRGEQDSIKNFLMPFYVAKPLKVELFKRKIEKMRA